MSKEKPKFLISGGGTGGHIFPALSIAQALRRRYPGAEFLFVGALGRMEMEKVPAAGYPIVGLPVAGFNRKNLLKNFAVLRKLWQSMRRARGIIRDFAPDIAIGVGGYASGPTLKCAQRMGIPTLLQEQNSYAGVTNKMLAKKARRICVAYPGMERFFPSSKIVMSGNPVRAEILAPAPDAAAARRSFGLDPDKPTVLVVGGSLGARTLNRSIQASLEEFARTGVQLIWQTGKNWGERGEKAAKGMQGIVVTNFLTDMATAYAAATLVVSRAGAGSISELEILGKPLVLVPSPNVAEDHQTKNARALSDRHAAVLIPDGEAEQRLVPAVLGMVKDPGKMKEMSENILKLALPDAGSIIAAEVSDIIGF